MVGKLCDIYNLEQLEYRLEYFERGDGPLHVTCILMNILQ